MCNLVRCCAPPVELVDASAPTLDKTPKNDNYTRVNHAVGYLQSTLRVVPIMTDDDYGLAVPTHQPCWMLGSEGGDLLPSFPLLTGAYSIPRRKMMGRKHEGVSSIAAEIAAWSPQMRALRHPDNGYNNSNHNSSHSRAK